VQTNRTIPNSKLENITCDQKSREPKIKKKPANRNTAPVERKNKVIPAIIQANGTLCKIIQKIPEQHTRKAQNHGVTKVAILGTAHTRTHNTHTLQEVQIRIVQNT
jgi:hypothetical protein